MCRCACRTEVALSFDGAMEVLQSCEGVDMKETATLDRLLKTLNVIERDLEEEGVNTFITSMQCTNWRWGIWTLYPVYGVSDKW